MSFIDNYLKLCGEIGEAPTAVLKNLGISHSMLSEWKIGKKPANKTLKKIADYFDITVAELNGEEQKKPATTSDDELTQDELRFLSLYKRLSPDKRGLIESLAIMLHNGK